MREIDFVPLREIRSIVVSGDMKASAFTTRLAAEGGETRITNRGRFIPGRWIPPLIGTALLEFETLSDLGALAKRGDVDLAVICCPWPQYRSLKFSPSTKVLATWQL